MRTNLLLDRDDTTRIFGLRVRHETVNFALVLVGIAFAMVLMVFGFEVFRIHEINDEASRIQIQDRLIASQVDTAHQLAADVLQLQKIADASIDIRATGNDSAVEIADLGTELHANSNTYLTGLSYSPTAGWDLLGVTNSVSDLGKAAYSVNQKARFRLISATDQNGRLLYHANVLTPQSAVPNPPAAALTSSATAIPGGVVTPVPSPAPSGGP
jgi:hypothetical protein